jgi:hypothetical protein
MGDLTISNPHTNRRSVCIAWFAGGIADGSSYHNSIVFAR